MVNNINNGKVQGSYNTNTNTSQTLIYMEIDLNNKKRRGFLNMLFRYIKPKTFKL